MKSIWMAVMLLVLATIMMAGCDSLQSGTTLPEDSVVLSASEYEALLVAKDEVNRLVDEVSGLKEELAKPSEDMVLDDIPKSGHGSLDLIGFQDETGKIGFKDVEGHVVYRPIFDSMTPLWSDEEEAVQVTIGLAHGVLFRDGYLRWEWIESASEDIIIQGDETYLDRDFAEFIETYRMAIANRDLEFFLSCIDFDTFSYNFSSGSEEDFKDEWTLNEQAEDSDLWPILEEVMGHGFTRVPSYYGDDNSKGFVAPYMFAYTLPFDAFEVFICTGSNINLRELPSANSKVLAQLNYSVVEIVTEDFDWESDFYHVKAKDGTEGYVHRDYLRSIIDYRMSFYKAGDQWKLGWLTAGD